MKVTREGETEKALEKDFSKRFWFLKECWNLLNYKDQEKEIFEIFLENEAGLRLAKKSKRKQIKKYYRNDMVTIEYKNSCEKYIYMLNISA